MSNYQKGKIYKITSPNTDMIYVGSTTTSLHRRFIHHRFETNHNKVNNSSANMFIWGDPTIELIESYPCNNKKELVLREQHYIDLYSDYCINARSAFTDKVEYGKEYRKSQRVKDKKKKWRDENREHLKEYFRKIAHTSKRKEQSQIYRDTHKEQISIRDKKYREANREKVQATKRRYNDYINSMGGDFRYNNNITRIDPNIFS